MCFERTVGRDRVLTRTPTDVSFGVRAQELVSIIGPSRCGKSTINERFYRSVGEGDKQQDDSVMAYDLIQAGARETATSGGA